MIEATVHVTIMVELEGTFTAENLDIAVDQAIRECRVSGEPTSTNALIRKVTKVAEA